MSESVLGRRRSAGGKPFHTVGATTEHALFCIIVVRANGTESNPLSNERRERLLREPDTGDKGRLGKSERGPMDIATPRRRPCILYAAGLGASEGPQACDLTHAQIWVLAL